MDATLTIEQRLIDLLRCLPLTKQKQILDFAEFICSQTQRQEISHSDSKPISALELAGDLIGSLEVGGDLSLKKHELKHQNLA